MTSDDFFNSGSLQVTWYNANGKRRVDDVGDGRQEDVKVFIKKRSGNGIKFTRLADALLIHVVHTYKSPGPVIIEVILNFQ